MWRRLQRAAGHLKLLYDTASIALDSDSIDHALQEALQRICPALDCPAAYAFTYDVHEQQIVLNEELWYFQSPRQLTTRVQTGPRRWNEHGGLVARVLATCEPQWSSNVADDSVYTRGPEPLRDLKIGSGIAFPVVVNNQVVAALQFFLRRRRRPNATLLRTVAEACYHLGYVFQHWELRKQLADLSIRQQQRVGRELHDGLGQQLTALAMLTRVIVNRLRTEGSPHAESIEELAEHLDGAQQQLRSVLEQCGPAEVAADDLYTALERLSANTARLCGIACRFECDVSAAAMSDVAATHLFRLAQEAVNNAVKHGHPTEVTLTLHRAGDHLQLVVRDNGEGFSPHDARCKGNGLRIMQYRARVIGATLDVQSGDGAGTTVTCTFKTTEDAAT